jgi:tetratricopeptide (TPR) repeat protein
LKILSHYNLAIELEHLKRYEEAIEEFTKAKDLAKQRGRKHVGIIMVCEESITRLK